MQTVRSVQDKYFYTEFHVIHKNIKRHSQILHGRLTIFYIPASDLNLCTMSMTNPTRLSAYKRCWFGYQ